MLLSSIKLKNEIFNTKILIINVNSVKGSKSFDIPSQNWTMIVINHVLSVSEWVIFGNIVHWDMPERFKESQSWQTITCRDSGPAILGDRTVITCKTCMVSYLHSTHFKLCKNRRADKKTQVSSFNLRYSLIFLKLGAWHEPRIKPYLQQSSIVISDLRMRNVIPKTSETIRYLNLLQAINRAQGKF